MLRFFYLCYYFNDAPDADVSDDAQRDGDGPPDDGESHDDDEQPGDGSGQ